MANNSDFLKIMVSDVTLHWPRLDHPYRYNNAEKRTEACAATVNGAGYSIAWDMPMDDARALHASLKEHYNACRAGNKKLPEFSQVFGMKKDEEAGTVRFTAKKRAMSNDGKENKPPRVIGGDLTDLDDKGIWSGSTGNLRVLAFPTTDPDGKGGISMLLDVVQVIEAVYGGDGIEDDFAPVKASKPMTEDFDAPTPQPEKQTPAMADDGGF